MYPRHHKETCTHVYIHTDMQTCLSVGVFMGSLWADRYVCGQSHRPTYPPVHHFTCNTHAYMLMCWRVDKLVWLRAGWRPISGVFDGCPERGVHHH